MILCEKCGKPIKKRSNAQNRSMFGIAYRMIADAMSELQGETITTDYVHNFCKDRFKDVLNEYRIDERTISLVSKKTGEVETVEKPVSTAKLSTVGAMRYYEHLQRFAAEYLGIDIPVPNEQDYSRIEKEG